MHQNRFIRTKTSLFFLLCLAPVVQIFAQNAPMKARYLQIRDSLVASYCCSEKTCVDTIKPGKNKPDTVWKGVRTVLPATLDSSLSAIFSTVILNNDDVINNGSAGSLAQDEKTAVLSFSYTYRIKKSNQFLSAGISAESTDGIWNLYSQNSWQNTMKLNLQYTYVPSTNSQFFDTPDCVKLSAKRFSFLDSLTIEHFKLINAPLENINQRMREIAPVLREDSLAIFNAGTDAETFDALQGRYLPMKKEFDSLQLIITKNREMQKLYESAKIDSMLSDAVTRFEISNNIFTGYVVNWWNFGGSFGNTTNKLYNDTLSRDSIVQFKTSDYARYRAWINYNRVYHSKKALVFFIPGISVFNSNFLEKRKLKDIPFIKQDTSGKYVYSAEETPELLGNLAELKKNIWVMNPSIYGACFFALKKTLGIELGGDYKMKLNDLSSLEFPDRYSLFGGVLIRVNATEELSKATLGISCGFFDAEKNARAGDYFAVRLKIGVPFNTVKKKKE
jgi:hypothetical protein